MQQQINRKETYSIASVTRDNEPIAFAVVTADIHSKNSLKMQALQEIYARALMSGCKEYDRDSLQEALGLLGSSVEVSTTDGMITLTIRSTANKIRKVLDILRCVILSPTFDLKEIARVKTLYSNELEEKKEESDVIAFEQFVNQIYASTDRRYAYDADALSSELANITQIDLLELHNKVMESFWYCAVGGSDKTINHINAFISEVKPSKINKRISTYKQKSPAKKVISTNISSRQNIDLSIGAPLPFTLIHEELPAFLFGINVLGNWGGFAGRLMSTVREKEGLTYGIYARVEGVRHSEAGYWRVQTFFSPEKVQQGIQSTFREINLIKEKGISEAEYKKFKNILRTNETLLRDSIVRTVRELQTFHVEDFTLNDIQEQKNKLLEVTRREINRTMKKYLDTDKLIISAAGPMKKVKGRLV